MIKRLSATFLTLLHDAALRSFWRRKALWRLLRQVGVSEGYLSTWREDESKREFLDRLFAALTSQADGQEVLLAMARDLAQQTSFPDLLGWEDSDHKQQAAARAVSALQAVLARVDGSLEEAARQADARRRARAVEAEVRESQLSLQRLERRLEGLSSRLGTQAAGYEFQDWFYDLVDYSELEHRRPYTTQGRQIDGSLTLAGTTYLVELKFTTEQAGATDVDTLIRKVTAKADNTMGIMVSMSGYSSVAVDEASGPRTPLLLLDSAHIYLSLRGTPLRDTIERVRRHASQTGRAYLPASDFNR